MKAFSVLEIPAIDLRFPIWLYQAIRPGDPADVSFADQTWVWAYELVDWPSHSGAIIEGHRLGGETDAATPGVFARVPELEPGAEIRVDDKPYTVYATEVRPVRDWASDPWRAHQDHGEVLSLSTCYWSAAGDDVEASARLFEQGQTHDMTFLAYCLPVLEADETQVKSAGEEYGHGTRPEPIEIRQ